MKKFRALSCFVFALCLVFYAVPRLPLNGVSQLATGFSVIWLGFAMLVIGSNLLHVVGSDKSGLAKRQTRDFTTLRERRIHLEGSKRKLPSVFK